MPNPVLIMAGGRGLRLHPLTESRPKPLLPVGTKPILRTIVDAFVRQGLTDITLALGYKAELIQAYFGDGSSCGCRISYIHEDEPLGTGGALRRLSFDEPVVVSNADVLTVVDYAHLLAAHASSGCLATVCTALYQHQIHYGVVDSVDGRLNALREKPIESFQVNAGIYVVSPEALLYAPQARRFDITDLLGRLPSANVYPLADFWIDIGRFEDLTRAHVAAMQESL